MKEWIFNEANHEGISYSNEEIASEYDENHQTFRNYEEEANEVITSLALTTESRIVDFAAGTGALTIELAKKCESVHAVDIAKEMLDQLQQKAKRESCENITVENGGFLTFKQPKSEFDAAVSSAALHHLPDFWKQIALRKMAESVKIGGRLFLADVVYDFPYSEYETELDIFVDLLGEANETMREETVVHIRDEMSTFGWIMERLLADAGFRIDRKISNSGIFVKYCCTRIK